MLRRDTLVIFPVAFLAGTSAVAQSPTRLSLSISYPPTIAAVWHLGPQVAVRPDLTYSRFAFDGGGRPSSTGSTLEAGVSTLHVFSDTDSVDVYLAPRVGYSSRRADGNPIGHTFAYSVSLGARAAIRRRLEAFGEIGVEHVRATITQYIFGDPFDTYRRDWRARSSVGLLLHLR